MQHCNDADVISSFRQAYTGDPNNGSDTKCRSSYKELLSKEFTQCKCRPTLKKM